ncbi:MAG TPA: TIM-barrel domain-containing protein [Terriglobales bacterium]|nr:TIM-barrel domain-containing protein [Terriglobales bacterium]
MSSRPSRRRALQALAAAGAGALLAPRWAAFAAEWELAGQPVELAFTSVSRRTLRITLRPLEAGQPSPLPDDGALVRTTWERPAAQWRNRVGPQTVRCGAFTLHVAAAPLRVRIEAPGGRLVQEIRAEAGPTGEAQVRYGFRLGAAPLFGLGQGGPQLDKRGQLDAMGSGQGGYQLATHGAKVPIQVLWSAEGWGLFVHLPLGAFDLTGPDTGWLLPRPDRGGHEPGEALPGAGQRALGLPLDLFVMDGAGAPPAALLAEYASLTGRAAMPPLWAFGYQQSHRTLGTPPSILDEAQTFREKKLPCDLMIYLGTGFCPDGWNTNNGEFAWNPKAFPDPPAALAALHRQHFKVALHVVLEGRKLTGTVAGACTAAPLPSGRTPDGRWPPDRQVACYWPFHQPLVEQGVDGWWPDQGDGLDAPSRLARIRMYFEGQQLYRPNQRVFALHRNGYAGMQRYAAFLWSGDIRSTWETLKTHIAVGINAGLSGIPYWGTDTGGFIPTPEYTGELYARWFQFSAFCPLFRSHGRDWRLHLPWGWTAGEIGYDEEPEYRPSAATLHNPAIEPICKKYLELRYRLLPYLYTAVHETCATGVPILRGLWLAYPDDPQAVARADQYLFGPDLLVAPVVEPGATARALYLPRGLWHDFWTGERVAGGREHTRPVDLATLPLYVRAGAVIPTGPVKQYVEEASSEPLTLTVYPGADGGGALYEDDGASFDCQRGQFMRLEFAWRDRARELRLRLAAGAMRPPRPRPLRIQVMGETTQRQVSFDGRPLAVIL